MRFVLVGLFFCLYASYASAQIVDEPAEIRIEFHGTMDTRMIEASLKLPITFGDAVTGQKHQYKYFVDRAGAVMLYCAWDTAKVPHCVFSIKKVSPGPTTRVQTIGTGIMATLLDPAEGEKLYDALAVKTLDEGGYTMKVLVDSRAHFGVSCLRTVQNPAVECQVRILP